VSHPESRLFVILDSDKSGAAINHYVIASFLDQFSQTRPDGTVNALVCLGRHGTIGRKNIRFQGVLIVSNQKSRLPAPNASAQGTDDIGTARPRLAAHYEQQRFSEAVELIGEIRLSLERLADISEAVETKVIGTP
jgi:hypothetical protein